MRENPAIFDSFRAVGSYQLHGQITGKAPTCRMRPIETYLARNAQLSAECRMIGAHLPYSTGASGMRERFSNNFGALRLLFAILVILSHSPELIDGNRSREILTRIFGTMSFGELGVDGFFLISGYLITKSFDNSKSPREYLIKRVLRIYPGYIAAFLFCVTAIGPFVGGQLTWSSIVIFIKNLALLEPPIMHGVFEGTPYSSLNGSMWTIAYEFRCYLTVLLAGIAGILSKRLIVALLTVVCLALTATHPSIFGWFPEKLQSIFGEPENAVKFTGVFGCGALFYLYRGNIRYNASTAALAGSCLIVLLFYSRLAEAALAVMGGYILFWFAFGVKSPSLAAVGQKTDLSYGMYLYAWPMQKLLIWSNPGISPWTLFLEATVIAGVLAFGSWWLVEKPFLNLKSASVPLLRTSVKA